MVRWFRIAARVLMAAFLIFAAYEAWRVLEAQKIARARIEAALAAQDPQVEKLSKARLDMLVAIEDPTFWANDGTDFSTPGQGWTTITQSLGKRILFDDFTPGFEKIELILASKFAITPAASKPEILSAALATAYLGHKDGRPVIGLAEGARAWWGRELDQLTDEEFLSLIAMLIAPNALDPLRHEAKNAERTARLKALLAGTCTPKNWGDVWLEGCKERG
ncbi:MAG: transglycosylase domain-containing protein [Alphaproteobacteria bacterium]|nr:transglycosylase domain-containing protein [Alphaproteobacteria bacterium]